MRLQSLLTFPNCPPQGSYQLMHRPATYEIVYFPQLGQRNVFGIFSNQSESERKKKKKGSSVLFFVFLL